MQRLVDAGCNVNLKNVFGKTALYEAIGSKHNGIIDTLFASGAQLNDVEIDYLSCLDRPVHRRGHLREGFIHELVRRGATSAKRQWQFLELSLLHTSTLDIQIFGLFFHKYVAMPTYATLSRVWSTDEIMLDNFASVPAQQRADLDSFSNARKSHGTIVKACEEARN